MDQRTAIIRGSLSGLFPDEEIDISADSFEGVINEKDIGTVVNRGKRLAIFDPSKLEDVAKKFAEIGCTSFRMDRDEIAAALEELNPSNLS